MYINPAAPVIARHEIEIFAPPEKVWDWLTRVDMWHTWRQDVSSARVIAGRGLNSIISWRHRKLLRITARVDAWSELREFGIIARPLGSDVRQVFTLNGDYRKTMIRSVTSVDGPMARPRLLHPIFRSQVNRTNEIWLGALKAKLEAGKGEAFSVAATRIGAERDPNYVPSKDPRFRA